MEMYRATRTIALCFLVSLSIAASADTLTGKVVKITDGDTLYVLDANYQQHKIRLAEIDAPERKQTFGNASRKHLATLVAGKQVTVKWDKRDRYSRIVGFVIVDGHDVNLAQVRAGKAVYAGSIPTPASISPKALTIFLRRCTLVCYRFATTDQSRDPLHRLGIGVVH